VSVGFVDEVEIHATGGRGGDGCLAFRREKYVPRGGPSGGDGGPGGSVVLVADAGLNTLSPLRNRGLYRAGRGRHGEGSNRHGRAGEDLEVAVPTGTVVKDAETGDLVADLTRDGQRFVVARGGRGGRGNARFATPTNRAPRHHEPGREGQDRWVRLELKLLADVGLLGLPNAGKSTLISRSAAARPRIAAYPFTTLVPNLGVVDWSDYHSFVVADIPGLIEGSHRGEGLGDQFLRHVERTAVLLHLVDVSDLADETPERAVEIIERELELYRPELLARPRLVVATKLDASTDDDRRRRLEALAAARGLAFLAISAVSGAGIPQLVVAAGDLVERERAVQRAARAEATQESEAERSAESWPTGADEPPWSGDDDTGEDAGHRARDEEE